MAGSVGVVASIGKTVRLFAARLSWFLMCWPWWPVPRALGVQVEQLIQRDPTSKAQLGSARSRRWKEKRIRCDKQDIQMRYKEKGGEMKADSLHDDHSILRVMHNLHNLQENFQSRG